MELTGLGGEETTLKCSNNVETGLQEQGMGLAESGYWRGEASGSRAKRINRGRIGSWRGNVMAEGDTRGVVAVLLDICVLRGGVRVFIPDWVQSIAFWALRSAIN